MIILESGFLLICPFFHLFSVSSDDLCLYFFKNNGIKIEAGQFCFLRGHLPRLSFATTGELDLHSQHYCLEGRGALRV